MGKYKNNSKREYGKLKKHIQKAFRITPLVSNLK